MSVPQPHKGVHTLINIYQQSKNVCQKNKYVYERNHLVSTHHATQLCPTQTHLHIYMNRIKYISQTKWSLGHEGGSGESSWHVVQNSYGEKTEPPPHPKSHRLKSYNFGYPRFMQCLARCCFQQPFLKIVLYSLLRAKTCCQSLT